MNALWGGGIKYGPVDAAARARMRRGLTVFTLVAAVAAGVVVGVLVSAWWGIVAAAIAAVLVGATARATLNDYE